MSEIQSKLNSRENNLNNTCFNSKRTRENCVRGVRKVRDSQQVSQMTRAKLTQNVVYRSLCTLVRFHSCKSVPNVKDNLEKVR